MKASRSIVGLSSALIVASAVLAQTPVGPGFTYQGRLMEAGQAFSGNRDLEFSLYDAFTDGNLLGTQSFPGWPISDGFFTAVLNASDELGVGAFNGQARWLEISVQGVPLAGRQEVMATPYALFSLGPWVNSDGNLSYTTGNVGVGTASPSATLDVIGTVKLDAFLLPTGAAAGQVLTSDESGNGTWQAPPGGGFSLPYSGSADVASPEAAFKVSNTGTGYALWGESASTDGFGVRGTATAPTGFAYGGYFESASPDGRAVFGSNAATTGAALGGRFGSASTSGRAVYATASAATGNTFGGYFESLSSTDGIGVCGLSNNSAGGTGVLGQANYLGSGVRGENPGAFGWGVYAQGRLGASGTKSLQIDHPDDPANKYLLHYAAESPEVINFYSGKVVLDTRGEAVVELPRYFARINKDPRYTLTAVGAPMPMLHVAEEIDEAALTAGAKALPGEATSVSSFRIAGGAPGKKVSWRVEALRNDKWLQQHGAPVEVEKQGVEKGTYQHPEFYGQPAEMGMNYRAVDESRR